MIGNLNLLAYIKDAINTFRTLTLKPQPTPHRLRRYGCSPIVGRGSNRPLLEDQQIEALMKMGVVRGTDLWSEDDRAPWSAQEIYNHFATEGNSNRATADIRAKLGTLNDFTDVWRRFTDNIPRKLWRLLARAPLPIKEGDYFSFIDEGSLHYAKLADIDNKQMIPC